MASRGENLYVFGGEKANEGGFSTETVSCIERYDACVDEWCLAEKADCARAGACVAVL